MTLDFKPAADKDPGHWVNPRWKEGTPGTFAVVIGVSRYEHLPEKPNLNDPKSRGLTQLFVSAITAYDFFCWLRDSYRHGCDLAKCWLLLAPTDAEKELIAKGQSQLSQPPVPFVLPTFQNCEHAILAWQQSMSALPPASGQTSRCFFFFTGHGLEITDERQILLPHDYRTDYQINKAVSSTNLLNGMAISQIREQFYFLDACRNDTPRLREWNIEGTAILDEAIQASWNRNRTAPMFYASADGEQAFQPHGNGGGSPGAVQQTLFGQALLEGLRAQGLSPTCQPPPCRIEILRLEGFLKARVNQLLESYRSQARQWPQRRGPIRVDSGITYVEPRSTAVAATFPSPPAPPPLPEALDASFSERPGALKGGILPTGWNPAKAYRSVMAPDGNTMGSPMPDPKAVFGSERIAAMLENARLFSIDKKAWIDAKEVLSINSVLHTAQNLDLRITFGILSPGSHWLQLQDAGADDTAFGCMLLHDGDGVIPNPLVYQLDIFRTGLKDAERRITRIEISLAADQSTAAQQKAAMLWSIYRQRDVGTALDAIDIDVARDLLANKFDSQVGALIAGMILLRNRSDRRKQFADLQAENWQGWLRNMTSFFPNRQEAWVLWLQNLIQEWDEPLIASDLPFWSKRLLNLPLPGTSECLSYLDEQLKLLLSPKLLISLDADTAQNIRSIRERVRDALSFFRPGGLFTIFAGPQNLLDPKLIIPP